MRLWSLHPRHLDARGLVALWREGLLARAVLRGLTRGYRNHPQLLRFRVQAAPRSAINAYLHLVCDEAAARGYRFDRSKLGLVRSPVAIPVTDGQMAFEEAHLRNKLAVRAPADLRRLGGAAGVEAHPIFCVVSGPVEPWERAR